MSSGSISWVNFSCARCEIVLIELCPTCRVGDNIAMPAQFFCAVDCHFVKIGNEFNRINLLIKA
jgi:hypothetical protein